MTSFHRIASDLRNKYDQAIHVHERRGSGMKREFVAKNMLSRKPQEEELVFLEKSPDFCDKNRKYGSLGTQSRACNRTSTGPDGCARLCCHRGFVTKRSLVTERCQCKFQWCCSVRCQTCQFEREEHFCK